jgi:hypothetical protein
MGTFLEEELIKKIKHEAIERDLKINDLIEKILKDYFEKKK